MKNKDIKSLQIILEIAEIITPTKATEQKINKLIRSYNDDK